MQQLFGGNDFISCPVLNAIEHAHMYGCRKNSFQVEQ